MKDLKHTKFDWKSIDLPHLRDKIIIADGLKIATVHLIYNKLEEQEANAKLIAAAPEMLNKLVEIRDNFNIYGVEWQEIDLLIKKATE